LRARVRARASERAGASTLAAALTRSANFAPLPSSPCAVCGRGDKDMISVAKALNFTL
jgi:hypothetical protein